MDRARRPSKVSHPANTESRALQRMVHLNFKAQCLLAAAAFYGTVGVAAAVCTSNLLVDDMSNSFSTQQNNLGSWTSGKIRYSSVTGYPFRALVDICWSIDDG